MELKSAGAALRLRTLNSWSLEREGKMTSTGLALFVFLAFLVPIPILAWLDRPPRGDGL